MIIVLKPDATQAQVDHIMEKIRERGLSPHLSKGQERSVIGVIGDERTMQNVPLAVFPGVESVTPILSPYKLVSREFRKDTTVVTVGDGVTIGGKTVPVMAGPCAVETKAQVTDVAKAVKGAGARVLRGGAFKPRTSPYAFQGLAEEGLQYLAEAKKVTGLPIITEVVDPRDIELVAQYADVLQIGARNMQNFRLLTEIGKQRKPVLLKRGLSATIKEFLLSAEYIMAGGNHNLMLCERGIRTFETQTRNTLDLSAVPLIQKLSHLPVVVDPSHATGRWDLVAPLARAAVAVGCDGLLIEVHTNPEEALCDGEESLTPAKFTTVMDELRKVAQAVGREI
ncbi:MAG: 3-deoxy-7-phosphoheptulonate synthase [Nitrospirota bacterium]